MKKIIAIVIVCCSIFSLNSFSQSGFIGKKNEIALDLFNTPINHQYGVNLKYAFSKHVGLIYGIQFYSHSKAGDNYKADVAIKPDQYLPNAKAFGVNTQIGLVYNSERGNLNIPIGYYVSFVFEYYHGILNNTIPVNTVNDEYLHNQKNQIELNWQFNTTCYQLNTILGNDIYLGNNITLDIGLKLGFTLTYFKSPEKYNSFFDPITDNRVYPITVSTNEWYSKSENFNLIPNLSNTNTIDYGKKVVQNTIPLQPTAAPVLTKFRLLTPGFDILPIIRIGYLF